MKRTNFLKHVLAVGALFALIPLSASGCSSDDDGGAPDNGGEVDSGPVDCTTQAGIDQCREQAMAEGNFCEQAGGCTCDSCACELQACEADPACVAIRRCAQETGCLGIVCYTNPAFCTQVIDDNGGTGGLGVALATPLSDCVTAAGCVSSCGDA
jgi:hypothetical protein